MDIVKRSGATEAYDGSKIVAAIAGAFSDVNREASEETLAALLRAAEESIAATDARTVEAIQDIVERSLMEQGYFDEAKAYILYRHRRAELRTVRADIVATAVASCDILSCGPRAVRRLLPRRLSRVHSGRFPGRAVCPFGAFRQIQELYQSRHVH